MLAQETGNGKPMVRRRTLALERRIRDLVVREAADKRKRAVLAAEQGQPKWPDRMMQDPMLEPVDRMVWMVLRQSAVRGRFPSYAQIGRAANVASKSTVSRAIAILRATRWLARYAEGAAQGEQRLSIHDADRRTIHDANELSNYRADRATARDAYVLADTPLPVADVMYLDGGYLVFLRTAQANSHARVRRVARDMLESLGEAADEKIPGDGDAHRHPRGKRPPEA